MAARCSSTRSATCRSSSQTRLLRVLSEREVTPIGGSRPTAVDMRVIAATHRDLLALVKQGKFREDLYFRLNGATIALPATARAQRLAWMVPQLLEQAALCGWLARAAFSAGARRLASYRWPGNIRELVNVIDFACAVASDPEIAMDDLPDQVFRAARNSRRSAEAARSATRHERGRSVARETCGARGWNVSAAARLLGIDRTTLHRRMRRLGVTLPPRAT